MDKLERKRKASDDDDDVDHLQEQILIRQLSSAAGPSCCPCVPCHCGCHTTAIEDLDSLPIGYRFEPTDKELITHYLLKKIQNQTIPMNKISEANIYEDHPKDIVGNYPQAIECAWYFFTSRNRKHVNGKRPTRKAGSGYWKATCPDEVIEDNGVKIGGKKSLVYHEGHPPNGTKTNWMMHEYVVQGYERQQSDLADMKLDDYVLCKIYYEADCGKQIIEQAVTNQQPGEPYETLRANLEVENQRALVPYQQPCLSSNQDVYSPPNQNPATLLVENHLLNSNKNLKDQQADVVTNQDTSHTDENDVVVQHLDSNPAIHHVENSFPVQSCNQQHMNPIVQNGDEEANRHVIVHDQPARVVSHQNVNNPTISDLISPYTMSPRPLQMTSFRRMIPPLAHHSSQPSGFTRMHLLENLPYLPSSLRQSPPLLHHIVQEQAHPGMYSSGQSSTPPTTSGHAEPTSFQRVFALDGDDGILDDNERGLDRHEQLDADDLGRTKR